MANVFQPPRYYPFTAYFDDNVDHRPFFQFGNLTADIPATSHVCFVFGGTVGQPHTVNAGAYLSGIWGGYDDTLGEDAFASNIMGSHHSSVIGNHCTIIGGGYNVITGDKPGSAIIGGSSHTIDSERAVCVGGYENNIEGLSNSLSTIVGGYDHDIIDSSYAAIVGGVDNEINASNYTCIIAGNDHVATNGSPYSAIIAGSGHTLNNADFAACIGGLTNTVTANYGVCLGGRGSSVSGLYGFASGRSCAATAAGAWALGDSNDSLMTNATANSFATRFAGGYRFTGGPTKPDGLDASGLPTSDPGIAGRVWVDGTALKVSLG